MKAYLLFDNEETREKFIGAVWEVIKGAGNEIEITEGADRVLVYEQSDFHGITKLKGTVDYPRPKKKVKKWKYAFVVANEIVCQTQHLSEDEVARMTCYGPKRIDETEIEVPEGTDGLSVSTYHKTRGDWPALLNVSIPRPKKKVKKWRWVIATKKGKDVGTTTHMTESELHRIYPNQKWYHRIDETMVEVEADE